MTAANFTSAFHRLVTDSTPDGELLTQYVQHRGERAFAALVDRQVGGAGDGR